MTVLYCWGDSGYQHIWHNMCECAGSSQSKIWCSTSKDSGKLCMKLFLERKKKKGFVFLIFQSTSLWEPCSFIVLFISHLTCFLFGRDSVRLWMKRILWVRGKGNHHQIIRVTGKGFKKSVVLHLMSLSSHWCGFNGVWITGLPSSM